MNAHSTKPSTKNSNESWVDYRAAIDRATAYIHSHNDGELQLDQLAEVAGFSPFHFHRIFAAMMGETVLSISAVYALARPYNSCCNRMRR